jgi:lipoprotein-anchoring transpeptidase ErfK/SrfK
MARDKKANRKKIIIDLLSQRLKGSSGDDVVFDFPCVTGDAKHITPKGTFRILNKERVRRSAKYNAQMNYALQITKSGIFIHESYNFIEDPAKQNFFGTAVSDSAATAMSRMRSWFPDVGELDIQVGNVNLTGSHGCIRLAHSDAVKLFDWADLNMSVEVK